MSQMKTPKNHLFRLFFYLLDDIFTNHFCHHFFCSFAKIFLKICLLETKICRIFAFVFQCWAYPTPLVRNLSSK